MKGQSLRDRLTTAHSRCRSSSTSASRSPTRCTRRTARHHPSRHQARQHLSDRTGTRQDPRLRSGEAHVESRIERRPLIRRRTPARPASRMGRQPTCRPSRRLVRRSTAAPICSLSEWCCTRARQDIIHFRARRRPLCLRAILDRSPASPLSHNPDLPVRLQRDHQQLPGEGSRAALPVGSRSPC